MNETIKELIPVFEKVAANIGESGTFVWKTVVKQQYVEAVENIIWGGLFLGIGLIVGSKIISYAATLGSLAGEEGSQTFVYALGYVVLLGGFGIGFGSLISAFKKLFNPEFYALDYFIEVVSGNGEEE